jgi:hypothetical protein
VLQERGEDANFMRLLGLLRLPAATQLTYESEILAAILSPLCCQGTLRSPRSSSAGSRPAQCSTSPYTMVAHQEGGELT